VASGEWRVLGTKYSVLVTRYHTRYSLLATRYFSPLATKLEEAMKLPLAALCLVVQAASAQSFTLDVGGLTRTYQIHLPRARPQGALPLVVLLHGRMGTGEGMARLSGFDSVADRAGILVAYPDGYRRSWADGRLGTPADRNGVDDVAFIQAMLADIADRYRVDRGRIYVAGMSNGGFMTERLACAMSDRLAAVGVVAATLSDSLSVRCAPARPISIMLINGTKDPLVPYEGGELSGDRGTALSVAKSVAFWAKSNRCPGKASDQLGTDFARDGTRIVQSSYSTCADGTEVVAVRVEEGGHTWPGGEQYLPPALIGKTTRNLSASSALWDFFSRHHR